jgi:hypothetical protein
LIHFRSQCKRGVVGNRGSQPKRPVTVASPHFPLPAWTALRICALCVEENGATQERQRDDGDPYGFRPFYQ